MPQSVVNPDEKTFDDAVRSGDWATAATSLAKLAIPRTKLPPLTIDQLRLLQDAVTRARCTLGGVGTVLHLAIAVALQHKGVPPTKITAGSAFGKLTATVDEKVNGDKATGTPYAYKINIIFTPDTAVIDADEIAFIQTVRLIETTNGSNTDPKKTNKKRQTPSATSVDRLPGKKQGWYGMKDDGTGSAKLTVWMISAPATPATVQDRPSWCQPDTTWEFETMVVCHSGADAGTVYAALTWGFTVDANLTLTEQAHTVTNKQSTEATTAVSLWNNQAAGSPADRNSPGQIPLPTLKQAQWPVDRGRRKLGVDGVFSHPRRGCHGQSRPRRAFALYLHVERRRVRGSESFEQKQASILGCHPARAEHHVAARAAIDVGNVVAVAQNPQSRSSGLLAAHDGTGDPELFRQVVTLQIRWRHVTLKRREGVVELALISRVSICRETAELAGGEDVVGRPRVVHPGGRGCGPGQHTDRGHDQTPFHYAHQSLLSAADPRPLRRGSVASRTLGRRAQRPRRASSIVAGGSSGS